jgi:6-pyruvoyltetrahydropterin/6-carboxytetrahydropterin synthase
MRGLGRYYELHVTCRGAADAQTGYFINIKHIDTAVRDHALPLLRRAVADETAAARAPLGRLMHEILSALQGPLEQQVHAVALQLTPFLAYHLRLDTMPTTTPADAPSPTLLLSQEYEFSAAHRLHVPGLSDEDNRATFGKCNNPAGHGHNYRVRVVVACPVDEHGQTLGPAELDAVVDEQLIEPLDHTHLNEDVPAFAARNPSVEHIVETAWGMLAGPLAERLPGCRLDELTVWETGKTACTYRGT